MTPVQMEKIFSLMEKYGVEHFKNGTFEVKLRAESKPPVKVEAPIVSTAKIPEPQAIPPVDLAIPHHVNEVANLLKLNDNDLVDKLFPDYSQPKMGSVNNA